MCFFDQPDLFVPEVDEVHVSVTFTGDKERAESLAETWKHVAPVTIGGPAYDDPGGEFVPGRYLKKGYVITSRGCPNKCWFCSVWKRSGDVKELDITEGWIMQDDNILACSENHIRSVFEMLSRQTNPVRLNGMEAKLLKEWHVDLIWDLKPQQMFFAYDTDDDLEPLVNAGKMLRYANRTRSSCSCYVLIGYRGDTVNKAEKRCLQAWDAGFMPFAMLYSDKNGKVDEDFKKFQRQWCRPPITKEVVRKLYRDSILMGERA